MSNVFNEGDRIYVVQNDKKRYGKIIRANYKLGDSEVVDLMWDDSTEPVRHINVLRLNLAVGGDLGQQYAAKMFEDRSHSDEDQQPEGHGMSDSPTDPVRDFVLAISKAVRDFQTWVDETVRQLQQTFKEPEESNESPGTTP